MKHAFLFQFFFFLILLFIINIVNAQSLLSEGPREFEELRLRQLNTVQNNNTISPFTTDGCSGGQSHNWALLSKTLPGFAAELGNKPPWEDCCKKHDMAYWRGDTIDGYNKRKKADEELKQCVVTTGEKLAPGLSKKYSVAEKSIRQAFLVTAELMYQAVRLGGQPCSLLPWRWGYGWPNCAFVSLSDIPMNYSDIKPDEHVTFFNTAAWQDTDNSHWNIPIHAWIYEPQDSIARKGVIAKLLESKYDLTVSSSNEENFSQRTNLLIADNERGKILKIRIAGQDVELPGSKENGHIFTILKIPAGVVDAFSNKGIIRFIAVTKPGEKRRYEGEIQLVPRHGVSVISDIDDTIKITNVTDHKKLFNNTFFNDFEDVPGMAVLYHQLAHHGVAIHFVSSSPWQLYDPLMGLVRNSGFPWATMNLKNVRFRDETIINLFKKGTETKPKQIEPILQHYPDRQFILIGDSGEQDPEVYGDIARRYPLQIRKILIRNVDTSSAEDMRYLNAFRGIKKEKWKLFEQPGEIVEIVMHDLSKEE